MSGATVFPANLNRSGGSASASPSNASGESSASGSSSPSVASKRMPLNNNHHRDIGSKSMLHVNFDAGNEISERKKKYLTAKYGQHQMSLIKKRLQVEIWMYDKLQELYGDVCNTGP